MIFASIPEGLTEVPLESRNPILIQVSSMVPSYIFSSTVDLKPNTYISTRHSGQMRDIFEKNYYLVHRIFNKQCVTTTH